MAFEIHQAGVGDGNTAVFRVDSEGAGQVLRGDGVGDGGALGVGGCHGDAGQRACEGGLADAARTGQFDEGRGLVVSLGSPVATRGVCLFSFIVLVQRCVGGLVCVDRGGRAGAVFGDGLLELDQLRGQIGVG